MLNGIFRSPDYSTAPIMDFRFIPPSFVAALWRPFLMIAPLRLVHVEKPAPDLRYALLLVLAVLLLLARWVGPLERRTGSRAGRRIGGEPGTARARLCVPHQLGHVAAAVWQQPLLHSDGLRGCGAGHGLGLPAPDGVAQGVRCAIAAMLLVQIHQVRAGAAFRAPYPWEGRQWFDVSVPHSLASQPALYFSVGVQSNSFVVPYLPAGSGFINLEGDYVLGPDGANGTHIRKLIARFAPQLRVLDLDSRVGAVHHSDVPHLSDVDDAVEPFGLRVDPGSCSGSWRGPIPRSRS